jgi:hypothetical protein
VDEVEHRKGRHVDCTCLQGRSTHKRVLLMLQCVDIIWGWFKRQTKATTPKNNVEGHMYRDDFLKCMDLILKKSNLKFQRMKQREQIRGCEPSLKPVNDGFAMED